MEKKKTDRSKYRNPDRPVGHEREVMPALVSPEERFFVIDGVPITQIQILSEVNADNRPDFDEMSKINFLSESDEDSDNTDSSPDKLKKKKSKKIKKARSDSRSPSRYKQSPPSRRSPSPGYKSRRSPLPAYKRHRTPSPNYHHDSPSRKKVAKIVSNSRSPSPVDVKLEPEGPFQRLFGSYHCDVCNITMKSAKNFQTHTTGKKHNKALKLKNLGQVAAKGIEVATVSEALKLKNLGQVVAKGIEVATVSENQTKYPEVRPGCRRIKVPTISYIQVHVEKNLNRPCPGLNFIIEIRLLGKTEYYCGLCDCSRMTPDSIMPHLNGYKHQLHCLKHFKPDVYKAMRYVPKYKLEKEITGILAAVERKEGRGRISVEVEELDSHGSLLDIHRPSTSSQSQSSTSSRSHSATSSRSQPSTSRNIKKLPGDRPSKTKTVHVPNKKAHLLERIKRELRDEPIVGLSEVRETEVLETRSHTYQCFLCGSCHTSMDILDHLISLKHRSKYLDHIEFPGREVTYGMSDSVAYNLVKDMCVQVESDEGMGNTEVHVNKKQCSEAIPKKSGEISERRYLYTIEEDEEETPDV